LENDRAQGDPDKRGLRRVKNHGKRCSEASALVNADLGKRNDKGVTEKFPPGDVRGKAKNKR